MAAALEEKGRAEVLAQKTKGHTTIDNGATHVVRGLNQVGTLELCLGDPAGWDRQAA